MKKSILYGGLIGLIVDILMTSQVKCVGNSCAKINIKNMSIVPIHIHIFIVLFFIILGLIINFIYQKFKK